MFRSTTRFSTALILTLVLPTISLLGPPSSNAHKPFVAAAQAGCSPSQNQIIQKACSLPVINQFEQAAVQTYLAIHSLPATDASNIYQSGGTQLRNDIRAFMLDLLVSYASQGGLATLDDVQGNAYAWLEYQVQAQEKKYWSAAAAEYSLWSGDKCHYKLDKDVAFQQGLNYDPVQWCYPNLGNYFATPPVPTYEYFLTVAWKQTYGSLIATSTSDSVILANTQRQTADYAALYTFPAALAAGTIGGLTVANNLKSISPFLGKVVSVKVANAPLARAEQAGYNITDKVTGEITQQAPKVVNEVEQAATKSLGELEEIAGEVFELASDLSAVDVIAIAVFAIETAVEAGISAVNTQQTLDKLATLPGMANQIAQNPPSLSTLLSSQDGYTKVSTVFVAATLPEYSKPVSNADFLPDGGDFYVRPSNLSLPTVVYKNALGANSSMSLRGGWFTSPTPGTSGSELVGAINYIDWQGNPRFARRVGPFQFLVYREDALATDHFCPASATDSHLSQGFTPDQCFSYVTDTLQMVDPNGQHISVEVISLPTLTSANYVNFTPLTYKAFPLTFTNSNDVPCSIARSGPLPPGIVYDPATFTFKGNNSIQYAGVYKQTLTVTCGGNNGLQSTYPFTVVVATSPDITFTSPSTISGTYGIPLSFKVTTTGAPPAKLTDFASGSDTLLNYYGLSFSDNGDGTGVISGRPQPFNYLCQADFAGTPCTLAIQADNGLQHVTQPLTLKLVDYPVPLSVSTPTSGTTLTFPINVSTTYVVLTKGAIPNLVQIGLGRQDIGGLPSWMNYHDNGDGTATIQGLPITANLGSTQMLLEAKWCCGPLIAVTFNASVIYPQPFISVAPNNSMAFLAGTAGSAVLTSNIQSQTGSFQPAGALPPGLKFNSISSNSGCTGFCPVQANISGTPAPGSGGDYKVPFTVSNPTGTVTQILDIVVYEKPALASESRLIFYAGVPSIAVVSASGFPTKSIGPFDDGVGYSAGASFSDPTASLPQFLKLTSGLSGAPNGTARLASTAMDRDIGLHPIRLTIQESAAPSQSVTNPSTQLGTTVNMNVYVVPAGDVNLDFRTDCSDLTTIRNSFGKVRGRAGYDSALDVNNDGIIDVRDLSWVASKLPAGTRCQ